MSRRTVRARARRLVGVAAGLCLVLGIVGTLANLHLVGQIERIEGAFDGLHDRPADMPGTTILLVGTSTMSSRAPAVGWLPNSTHLESLMLVQIPQGTARRVSVDFLPMGGELARSVGSTRPSDTVGAAESVLGTRVDHLAALDWDALQQLADDNGGVLTYRSGAPTAEQAWFLSNVIEDTLHVEMRREPWNLFTALDTVTRGLAVEEEWSLLEMDLLVLALRNLRSADIEYDVTPAGR